MILKFSLGNHRSQEEISQNLLEVMKKISPHDPVEVFRSGHNESIECESRFWDLYMHNRQELQINHRRYDEKNRYAGEWTLVTLTF